MYIVSYNIVYQSLSVLTVISENSRMLYLWPLTVNIVKILIEYGKSLSTRLLILQWLARVANQL